MPQSIREVMTPNPISLSDSAPVLDAAQAMRDSNIGDVIVLDQSDEMCGIVTDRDIVVRVLAEGKDPQATSLSEICSSDVLSLAPDDAVDDAVKMMREKAVRRMPVVEGGKPIGIVSIGDLAIERDSDSALADISAAEPNK
ncbi:MAG: CBS domain-containing protein [Actinomycetota bacterium]